MSQLIKVSIADLKLCKAPDSVTTLGLGSCVGIAIRDPVTKIGGLAHIMLPDSTAVRNNGNRPKFADTGIDDLVSLVVGAGASRQRLVAKIAGGAQMFDFSNKPNMVRVGDRNVEAVKAKLKMLNIKIIAEDTGLNFGRTVIFYPENGNFVIRSVGKPEKVI